MLLVTLPQQRIAPLDSLDSLAVRSPLPGGVGAFVRTVLNQPSWVQKTVIPLVALAAVGVITLIWRRRAPILAWLGARSRAWKIALAATAVTVAVGFVGFSATVWHYTQHNNEFCVGCHVMNEAWTRFQHSEHRKLECHDCHRQSIFASMKQLYLWVAERPADIPPHAKVPTGICQECHNQEQADSSWKRVIATAGHRIHLHSDSSALRNVQCVTCHGAEIHHFVPIDRTCGQSNCHEALRVRLGKMAGQTSLHCTGCHAFRAAVAENLSPDSVRKSLVPTANECLTCHAMQRRMGNTLAELDPAREPHHAVCGTCHNPHKQETPKAAFASCATGGCHTRADTLTPFHRGLPRGVLASCGSCHAAHQWKVKSTECAACHRELDRPMPAAAPLTASGRSPPVGRAHGPSAESDDTEGVEQPPFVLAQAPARDTATFRHKQHETLACASCHSAKKTHGQVTFSRPDGCLTCHHAAEQRVACVDCHSRARLPSRVTAVAMSLSVRTAPLERSLSFRHDDHGKLNCRDCHTASNRLAVARDCASCHAQHHTAASTCVTCHTEPSAAVRAQHPREATHAGCGGTGCHTDAAVLALPPANSLCLACHGEQAQHKVGRECVACHAVPWGAAPPEGGGR